jgi:trimeric autotransporter adhesin
MSGPLHHHQTVVHRPFAAVYADEAARLAAVGFDGASEFFATDLYKIVLQESDNTVWVLTAVTPTWSPIADAGGLPDAPNDGQFYGRLSAAWETFINYATAQAAAIRTALGLGDLATENANIIPLDKQSSNDAIFVRGSGGNSRGTGATDLQPSRNADTQVASGFRSFIGGGWRNTASNNFAVIGGGDTNVASATYSVVSGGQNNQVIHPYGTVGGGANNVASGHVGGAGTVAGGTSNQATWANAFIGGGSSNVSSAVGSAVLGGNSNTAAGDYSSVVGGQNSNAGQNYAVAGGRRAKAIHAGALVLSDGVNEDATSTAANEATLQYTGGIRLITGTDGLGAPTNTVSIDTGAVIQPGGYKSSDGSAGWTGTFQDGVGNTVTVKDGIITNVSP